MRARGSRNGAFEHGGEWEWKRAAALGNSLAVSQT